MPRLIDGTVPLLLQGYARAPDLRRRHGDPSAVRSRHTGRPAPLLQGPAAVDFFYDERHVLRDGALPGPVLDTLFGRGAVQTLDGERHRLRKALFVSLLMGDGSVDELTALVRGHWAAAVDGRQGRGAVLFDEAVTVLARAVCDWTGPAVPEDAAREVSEDCVAMVDGFTPPGPRHWRARREESLARTVEELRGGATRLHRALPTGAGDTAPETVARHRDADGHHHDPALWSDHHRIPTRPRSGFTVSVPSRQRSHHAPRFQSQA
ncbi:hypothetical protein [Streptomyces sp. NBC_00158]|uniref:hypothetical protein n=1 Tax=Streptomyces sp. NBC_00158 TaxID=2903627 RepID=UPI00324847A9